MAEDPSQLLDRLSDFLGKHQTDERSSAVTVAPAGGLRDRIETFVVHHGSSLGSVSVEGSQSGSAVAGDPVPSCIVEAHMDTARTVPNPHIAVHGDAPRTRDSRHFGLVPAAAVLGIACRTRRDKGTA